MAGGKWDKVFAERLSRHYDELKWLYFELYYGNEEAFDYFLSMLWRNYSERKQELRELDAEREARPDWYRQDELVGMLMYTQCFAGNLKGVRKHLDYIQECGVNYVHLMPLLQSPEGRSDGGYAVSDFRKVEPSLGTMKDLETLSDACHEKGMSVCLDFVMNHTSEDHEWAVRARAGEKECRDRYFFFDNWNIPNDFEKTVPQVFPQTAPGNFTWCEEAGKVVMTTFYPYQWDLNYANPTVFNDMTDNMLYLCNRGVDVIRLDAVPYIWKQLGTSCRNLPQVHTLVRLMRMAAEIVCPGTLLLGEVVMEPSKVVPYFGTVEKPECHILYNVTTMASTWHTVATHDVRLLKHQLGTVFALPRQYTFLNYLRCHDDIGWGLDYEFLRQFGVEEAAHKKFLNDYFRGLIYDSPSRGELYNDDPRLMDARLCGTTASLCGLESALAGSDAQAVERALRLDIMLHAFLFTQSGIPVLYSGDEIAQLNHVIGGATVRIEDDFSKVDPTLVEGEEITLTDEQAYNYLHARLDVGDGENESRMRRQTAYMEAVYDKVIDRVRTEKNFLDDITDTLGEAVTTNMNGEDFAQFRDIFREGRSLGIQMPEGESVLGRRLEDGLEHTEFYIDEASLAEIMVQMCNLEVDEFTDWDDLETETELW